MTSNKPYIQKSPPGGVSWTNILLCIHTKIRKTWQTATSGLTSGNFTKQQYSFSRFCGDLLLCFDQFVSKLWTTSTCHCNIYTFNMLNIKTRKDLHFAAVKLILYAINCFKMIHFHKRLMDKGYVMVGQGLNGGGGVWKGINGCMCDFVLIIV